MTDLSAEALAAIAAEGEGGPKKAKSKLLPTIVAVVVLTLVADRRRRGHGHADRRRQAATRRPAPAEAAAAGGGEAAGEASAEAAADEGTEANPTVLVKLPAVLTNIATPPKTLLRVEASIVLHSKPTSRTSTSSPPRSRPTRWPSCAPSISRRSRARAASCTCART